MNFYKTLGLKNSRIDVADASEFLEEILEKEGIQK